MFFLIISGYFPSHLQEYFDWAVCKKGREKEFSVIHLHDLLSFNLRKRYSSEAEGEDRKGLDTSNTLPSSY